MHVLSRRRFMQAGAGALALFGLRRRAFAYAQSPGLAKFRPDWALQGLGDTGLPVMTSDGMRHYAGGISATHYTIDMRSFTQVLHPQLGPTRLWGYGQKGNHRHLGGVIVAQKNVPSQITFRNLLDLPHPVNTKRDSIDRTGYLMDAMDQADNRVSVHLHGGFTPWISDGAPMSYFGVAGGVAGPTYSPDMMNFASDGLNTKAGASLGYAEYYWPNQQGSRLMWYHDHAMDITRVNAYGGLATAYILRDDLENSLIQAGAIPTREVPLIFQDKIFNGDGSLWYPNEYESAGPGARWDLGRQIGGKMEPPEPSCVPEFFGDTILCNGTAYPSMTVTKNRYRFRILNAFQGRFMNLTLWRLPSGASELPLRNDGRGIPSVNPDNHEFIAPNMVPDTVQGAAPGPDMIQIATEGGFLRAPVRFTSSNQTVIGFDPDTGNVNRRSLLIAPAERADILVDFSGCNVGDRIVLWNDAPAPFPGGDPRNDCFYGQDDFSQPSGNLFGVTGGNAGPGMGQGPNTRSILQFTVTAASGTDMPESTMLSLLNSQLANAFTTLDPRQAECVRELTLNEDYDSWGRLIQRLGTDQPNPQPKLTGIVSNPKDFYVTPMGETTYGRAFYEDSTEIVHHGSVEIWRIWNLTGDTHPIHFHLVNVQILSRESFDGVEPQSGKPLAPLYQGVDANEMGWKETVRINPGEAITVIMRFDLPEVPFRQPLSPRAGTVGHEYMWHCHILEHEEHDMMRPFVVVPRSRDCHGGSTGSVPDESGSLPIERNCRF
jgi:spore coat protein A